MKLIECSAFVLEQNKEYWSTELGAEKFQTVVSNYAKLLRQSLGLWMFVPWDGDVLECPSNLTFELAKDGHTASTWIVDEYKQAKSRCIFEGFEVIKYIDEYYTLNDAQGNYIYFDDELKMLYRSSNDRAFTIEDLVPYGLTLTATAIKKIGL